MRSQFKNKEIETKRLVHSPGEVGAPHCPDGAILMDFAAVTRQQLGGKISIWVTTATSPLTVRYAVKVSVEFEVEPCSQGTYGTGGAACFSLGPHHEALTAPSLASMA